MFFTGVVGLGPGRGPGPGPGAGPGPVCNTCFFSPICEADSLTAFGLVSSTGSAKQILQPPWD